MPAESKQLADFLLSAPIRRSKPLSTSGITATFSRASLLGKILIDTAPTAKEIQPGGALTSLLKQALSHSRHVTPLKGASRDIKVNLGLSPRLRSRLVTGHSPT